MDYENQIICGDAREVLAQMPEESVHCAITSPPYWGLRDYGKGTECVFGGDEGCEHEWGGDFSPSTKVGKQGMTEDIKWPAIVEAQGKPAGSQFCSLCGAWRGQYGLEPTPGMYVEHTLEFLRAIWRVLRKDGTVWWNIGDSYASSGSGGATQDGIHRGEELKAQPGYKSSFRDSRYLNQPSPRTAVGNIKPKDLVMIPFRVALAAQADGWYVRQVIIWEKPNPMPESVRDRCTTSHEYILLMAKSKNYYMDMDAIREPQKDLHLVSSNFGRLSESNKFSTIEGNRSVRYGTKWSPKEREYNPAGRNRRSVWTIPTSPYPGPHYATFPPDLIEPMILAGTSPKVCAECGAPWERVTEKDYDERDGKIERSADEKYDGHYAGLGTNPGMGRAQMIVSTLGWRPTCSCNADTKPALVLDPFAGTGTVAQKCIEHHRDYVMIDIDPKSIELAKKRTKAVQMRLVL